MCPSLVTFFSVLPLFLYLHCGVPAPVLLHVVDHLLPPVGGRVLLAIAVRVGAVVLLAPAAEDSKREGKRREEENV